MDPGRIVMFFDEKLTSGISANFSRALIRDEAPDCGTAALLARRLEQVPPGMILFPACHSKVAYWWKILFQPFSTVPTREKARY